MVCASHCRAEEVAPSAVGADSVAIIEAGPDSTSAVAAADAEPEPAELEMGNIVAVKTYVVTCVCYSNNCSSFQT